MRALNQSGPRLRREIASPPSLSPPEFEQAMQAGALVVDTRPQADFMAAHIPGALSNTFRDAFATWLGWLAPAGTPLLFVLGDEPLDRVIDECLLVAYERFVGVLAGGMAAWENAGLPVGRAALATAPEASQLLLDGAFVLDVREANEYAEGHIPGATHIPLGQLKRRLEELPHDRPIVTSCGHGERSATALSLIEAYGLRPLTNLDGGIDAWRDAGLEVER